jgi:hypothetical protein
MEKEKEKRDRGLRRRLSLIEKKRKEEKRKS